jgi:hypothetical protein
VSAALAAFALSGAWVLIGLSLNSGNQRRWEHWPWAYGAGVVIQAYAIFLFNLIGFRMTSPRYVFLLAALLAVGLFRVISQPKIAGAEESQRLEFPRAATLTFFLIVLAVVTTAFQATALPIYHLDAVLHFGMSGKILFHEGTFWVPHFTEPGIMHSGPDYPLLVPYVYASFYWLLGAVQDDAVRLLFLIPWIAILALVYSRFRQTTDLAYRVLWTALLGTLPALVIDELTQVASGVTDIFFAFFWLGTLVSAVSYLENRRRTWLLWMVVFSLGAVFTKPNGLLLSGVAWGLLIWLRRRREVFVAAAVLALLTGPWLWAHFQLPHDVTQPPVRITISTWSQLVPRSAEIAAAVIRGLLDLRFWGVFWPVAIFFLCRRSYRDAASRFLGVALLLQAMVYVGFWLVDVRSAAGIVEASLPRWLLHGVPVVGLLAGANPERVPALRERMPNTLLG